MKKFFYSLGIIAATAFAFSSCQKEQSTKDEQPSDNLVTVTFTAEKAGVGTKTAAVEGEEEVSFVWTEEDIANIKLFEVGKDDQGKEALTVVENPTVTKESNTRLTISASVAPGNHVFRAVLSGIWTNDGKKPRVNASQSPKSNNFDPNADVLVSDDKEVSLVEGGEATMSTDPQLMTFRRPIVVNKMTLKNLTAGETIDNVVITSDKNLTGYFNYNPTAASGDGKVITLNFNNEITIPDNGEGVGEVPVYFTTIPGTEQTLTVEVTTNQKVYTKSFGKTIDFIKGQFTVFGVAFPAGTPRTSLVLPIEDNMEWATTHGSDGAEITAADWADVTQDGKKIYDSATKVFKGGDGMKFGNSSAAGSITTKEIDLSSAFYIAIEAKDYGSDASELVIKVDGNDVITNANLTADYETYFVNCAAASANSKITIGMTNRGYITNLVIGSGTYVAPPKINVTSENPMEVPNGNDLYSIEYTVSNPVEGVTISADANVDWIHDFDYSSAGEVSFEVDAQAAGAASRDGIITLSYAGANDVEVTVSQAAGEGGTSTYTYTFTSTSWAATPDDWTCDKNASATGDSRGISIQAAASGAGATSPVTFTGVSNVTMTLSKSSKGVGSVDIYVGETKIGTQSSFTTTATAYSFDVNNLDGSVKFVVNCSTSTLYVKDISITAAGTGGETITVSTPTFSVEGGTYTSTQTVEIECETAGATIYYTLDGSTPDNTKSVYSSALTISATTTVKAIAIKDGVSSEVTEVTYTINNGGGDLPTDYSTVYTSNVTLSKGTSAQDYTLTIDESEYSGIKAGASKNGGSMSFSIPSGTTRITLHAQGWGSDTPTVNIASNLGTVSPSSFSPIANSEYSGNGTAFTITTTAEDYFVFNVAGVSSEATITISTEGAKNRFVVWGVNVD